LSKKDLNVKNSVEERIKAISNDSSSAQIYADISNAKNAFAEIKSLEAKKCQFEEQEKSLELIYDKFVEQEKSGLKNFISVLSESINRFYQKMNPEEPFSGYKDY